MKRKYYTDGNLAMNSFRVAEEKIEIGRGVTDVAEDEVGGSEDEVGGSEDEVGGSEDEVGVGEDEISLTERGADRVDRVDEYESLTITSNFIFCKIMETHEDLCRELIEMITGIDVKFIRIDKEKTYDYAHDARGIRLDVYVEDANGHQFDIEMQKLDKGNLPKRSRYYSSMMDVTAIEKGTQIDELMDSYVIFITTFDPFGLGLRKYGFSKRCDGDWSLELGDMTKTIFICADGSSGEISEELDSFIRYVAGNAPDTDYTKKLDEAVGIARHNKEWRRQYMTYEMHIREERALARKEGIAEGIEQGVSNIVLNAYANGKTAEEIAEFNGIPYDQVTAILANGGDSI